MDYIRYDRVPLVLAVVQILRSVKSPDEAVTALSQVRPLDADGCETVGAVFVCHYSMEDVVDWIDSIRSWINSDSQDPTHLKSVADQIELIISKARLNDFNFRNEPRLTFQAISTLKFLRDYNYNERRQQLLEETVEAKTDRFFGDI